MYPGRKESDQEDNNAQAKYNEDLRGGHYRSSLLVTQREFEGWMVNLAPSDLRLFCSTPRNPMMSFWTSDIPRDATN